MEKNKLPIKKAVLIFFTFACGYFISALLRAITATLSPLLTTEFNLTAGDLGLLAGGYCLGFASMKIPLGYLLDRKDKSLVTNLSLKGDVNQLFPFLQKINKDDNFFYTLSYRESNVNSNISSYEIKRSFKTINITKRINFND